MKNITKQINLIFLLNLLLGFSIIAQEKNYFVDKPDKNIKRILIYSIDTENDTSGLNSVIEFNKDGNVVKETQPDYHIHVSYKYDMKGRLIEKEALYGESFANGITSFEYYDKLEIEKNQAMGYYSETRKELNELGKTIKSTTYYVAGGMGESKIESVVFTYGNEGFLSNKSINITYFNLEIEPGEIQEIKPKNLITKLKTAEVNRKEQITEKYKYNSAKNLIQKELLKGEKEKLLVSTSYEYNNSGLLIKKLKNCIKHSNEIVNYTCDEIEEKRKYNSKNQLESITVKKDNYLNINLYNEGKLVNSTEKYSSNLSYRYAYKYEYYMN